MQASHTNQNRETGTWRRLCALVRKSVLRLFGTEVTRGEPMSDELKMLIEMARTVQMTPEEKEAQRISFAYGNAKIADDSITRDDVVRASQRLRERANEQSASAR